jgi:probable phosphoglycerate mutase
MPTLLLIRHGENSFVGKRLAGRLPGVSLNERGQRQAQQLAEMLAKAPIKAVYSSPLARALETAQPLAQALNLEAISWDGLLETDYGRWAGRSLKLLVKRPLWKVVQETPSEVRFPGGESLVECQARIVRALEEIAARHTKDELVACVLHSDPIKLAAAHYLGMPLDAFQRLNIDTASITTLHLEGGKGHFGAINVSLPWQPPA